MDQPHNIVYIPLYMGKLPPAVSRTKRLFFFLFRATTQHSTIAMIPPSTRAPPTAAMMIMLVIEKAADGGTVVVSTCVVVVVASKEGVGEGGKEGEGGAEGGEGDERGVTTGMVEVREGEGNTVVDATAEGLDTMDRAEKMEEVEIPDKVVDEERDVERGGEIEEDMKVVVETTMGVLRPPVSRVDEVAVDSGRSNPGEVVELGIGEDGAGVMGTGMKEKDVD